MLLGRYSSLRSPGMAAFKGKPEGGGANVPLDFWEVNRDIFPSTFGKSHFANPLATFSVCISARSLENLPPTQAALKH